MEADKITPVRAINTIYDIIKGIKFIGEEVKILKDIKEIENQLRNFNFAAGDNTYKELTKKYFNKLNEMGYYNFNNKNPNLTPAERLKYNLNVLGKWLVRIAALKACAEVAQTALKKLIKEAIKKYESAEVAERAELVYNVLNEFDDILLEKLQNNW